MIRILDIPDAAPVLFPDQHITKFIEYLRAVWADLKALTPVWWADKRETTLVNAFYRELKNDERLMQAGVGYGHLVLEGIEIYMDAKGMPKQSGRTDIRFIYAIDFGPELVLEFKRLDNSSHLRREYVHSGVKRFSSGQYSPESDFGIMVGMVTGAVAREKTSIIRYLGRAATVAALSLQRCDDPAINGGFDFDTSHSRPPACLARMIRVGHVLLER
ncbi:hypothetical protein [Rhizobium herbae]|uniref:DUF4263 domain-containing protein n=1 Tax=Rhizobium herbae TaxID=508661 RepID=A0ABS4EKI5_9HYPH|nr:hypothetical protein [Rhizobium herbae]MBP1858459.1 hypothetical protein [Rhizobium herbae]